MIGLGWSKGIKRMKTSFGLMGLTQCTQTGQMVVSNYLRCCMHIILSFCWVSSFNRTFRISWSIRLWERSNHELKCAMDRRICTFDCVTRKQKECRVQTSLDRSYWKQIFIWNYFVELNGKWRATYWPLLLRRCALFGGGDGDLQNIFYYIK